MILLILLFLIPIAAALPTQSTVVFPTDGDWWVIGAENTLVFNWAGKEGEPATTLYNLDPDLMPAPFFWESQFYVTPGRNVVKSSAALVGAKPGDGYYIGIDVAGKHLTSHTFEIKAAGSKPDADPEAQSAANVDSRGGAARRFDTAFSILGSRLDVGVAAGIGLLAMNV